jgi:hypothetical protein
MLGFTPAMVGSTNTSKSSKETEQRTRSANDKLMLLHGRPSTLQRMLDQHCSQRHDR